MSMSTRKQGLDDIASVIRNVRSSITTSQAKVVSSLNELTELPTTYADILTEINALGSVDASDILQKDELDKLTTEFIGLRDMAQSMVDAVDGLEE